MAIPAVCHWVVRRWHLRNVQNVKQPGSLGRVSTLGNTTTSLDVDSRVHIDYRSVHCRALIELRIDAVCSVKGVDRSGSRRQPSPTDDLRPRRSSASPSISTTDGEDHPHGDVPGAAHIPATGPPRPIASASTRLSRLWRDDQQLSVHMLHASSGRRAAASA